MEKKFNVTYAAGEGRFCHDGIDYMIVWIPVGLVENDLKYRGHIYSSSPARDGERIEIETSIQHDLLKDIFVMELYAETLFDPDDEEGSYDDLRNAILTMAGKCGISKEILKFQYDD